MSDLFDDILGVDAAAPLSKPSVVEENAAADDMPLEAIEAELAARQAEVPVTPVPKAQLRTIVDDIISSVDVVVEAPNQRRGRPTDEPFVPPAEKQGPVVTQRRNRFRDILRR